MQKKLMFPPERLLRAFFVMLCLVLMLPVFAQSQLQCTGTVTDEKGEPMIGVSVVEKGTKNGAVTDLDGKFALSAKNGATLQFTYVGYNSQELKAAANMQVTMTEDRKLIDEVVVVGYGVQKKSSLTGAVSQVKSEDMQSRTITNASQALQGKTAGVQIMGSAAPGSSPTVRVRGVASNGSSSPLYVVDGRIAGGIGNLDPNDIESMEVLKDGASAAIYGAQAGNGVILITTKKGKGNGKITYEYQMTRQSLGHTPKVLNSEEFIQYYVEEAGILGRETVYNNWDFKTNTDWIKETFETANMERHNVTFSAGNDKGSLYVSGSYLTNNGIVKGDADTYRRITGMINGNWKIKPWLEIQTNNQIAHTKSRSVSEGSEYGSTILAALQLDPLTKYSYTLADMPDNMRAAYDFWQANGRKELLGDGNGNYWGISPFVTMDNLNPMISRDSGYNEGRGFNLNGTTSLNFTPIKGFVFTSRLSYNFNAGESYGVGYDYYGNAKSERDYITLSSSNSSSTYFQWENFANYNKTLFNDHNIGVMLGTSYSESRSYSTSGGKEGFKETRQDADGNDYTYVDMGVKKDDPLFWYMSYATADAKKSISGGEPGYSRKYGMFGRLSYDYKSKYLVQYNVRADAADSSVLPIDNRWGVFHGLSLGWTITNEKFMESTRSWLDFMKFRASWGQNGSTASLGGYQYANVIASTGNYPTNTDINSTAYGYVTAYAPSSTGNLDLKWETSEQTNIGLDMRFLSGRFSVTMDYFMKKTKDLIVSGITPSTVVGNTASPVNAGNIENKGFELELGWQDHIGDFRYSVRGNLSTLKNKVTYIHPTLKEGLSGTGFHTYGTITRFEVGHPAWYFYGYKFTGINPETGNPEFEDLNGDGSIGAEDKTEIGKGMADLTFGLTLTAAYKGFDAIVFGSGTAGNDIYSCIDRTDNLVNKIKAYVEDRWTPTHTNGTQPRANANDYDKYMTSSAMVYDGSYFKIKQIQLGYTLPKNLTKKAFIENIRLYVSMEDFFTFTNYKGFDPEVTGVGSSLGVDKGSYPGAKKLLFGANVTF